MPDIPDKAPQPQDRKPKKPRKSVYARRAEADGYALVELKRGVTIRVPMGGKLPLAVIELLDKHEIEGPPKTPSEERRREFATTRELLGPDEWETFQSIRPTLDDYTELAEKIAELKGN